MRDDQPHKPDHARHVHDKSHHQRSDDQIYPPVRLQVRPQRDRRVIPHEHQVQYPRLGNKEKRAGQHDAQNTKITAPLCAGQASHQPELHRHKPARVIRDVHDQVRKSRAERAQCNAGQNQLYRSDAPPDAGNGDYGKCGRQRTDERPESHSGRTEKSCAQQERKCSAQRCAGGNTQHIRIRQRIFDDGLHHCPHHGQPHSDQNSQYNARQADQPYNIVYRSAAELLRVSPAEQLVQDHPVNLPHR